MELPTTVLYKPKTKLGKALMAFSGMGSVATQKWYHRNRAVEASPKVVTARRMAVAAGSGGRSKSEKKKTISE